MSRGPSAETKLRARAEWRQYWPLVIAASLAFSFTSVMTAAAGLFMEPLGREFGWSRTLLSSGMSISAVTTFLLSPLFGLLIDRLGSSRRTGPARYRLDVRLDDKLEGLGLLSDDTVTRERRTLRARYQLVDLATGQIVLDETVGLDAGIDVVSSEYATVAAENTALENLTKEVSDRIVTRIALKLRALDAAGK